MYVPLSLTGVFYNSTGTKTCYNVTEEFVPCADPTGCGIGPSAVAWNYQVCSGLGVDVVVYGWFRAGMRLCG